MSSLDAIIRELRRAAARARAARYAVHGLVGAVAWLIGVKYLPADTARVEAATAHG